MSALRRHILNITNWTISHSNAVNESLMFYSRKLELPLPPKRPLTGYMIFCKENRKELLKENPGLSSPEQIKRLAEKWNQLTLESKKPFEILARENTLQYGEEHKKFYENLTDDQKEELARRKLEKKETRRLLRLKKALRESGLPKRPLSTYALFVQSFAKDATKQTTEFLKEAAEKWKSLPEETKKSFEKQAEAEKIRFSSEIELWRNRMIKEGKENLIKDYNELKSSSKSLISEVVEAPDVKVKKILKSKQATTHKKA